jgi:Na+/proline symporter
MVNTLNAYDYLVLTLVLALSILIGLYFALQAKYGNFFKRCSKRKLDASDEADGTQMKQYLTAGGEMHFIPLAFSLLASNFSASGMLGYPGKLYGLHF